MLTTIRAVAYRLSFRDEPSISRLIFSFSTCLPTAAQPVIATASSRFLSALDSCSTLRHLNQAHAFMLAAALDRDDRLFTRFVNATSSLGHASYCFSVFSSRRHFAPDLFLCNAVISSLAHTDLAVNAVSLYNRIQTLGLRPDWYSIPSVLKAATHLGNVGLGTQVHAQATGVGLSSELYVRTGLLRMYGSCGEVRDAQAVLDELSLGHVMLWNAVLAAYAKSGNVVRTRELFDNAPERNLVTWTTVISACAHESHPAAAIRFFHRMQVEDGIMPDEIALLAALTACADLGSLKLGKSIHDYIIKHGFIGVPLMNALIDMYSKSGDIQKAVELFERMSCRSVVSWSTIISGLALHGLGNQALDVLSRMKAANVKPNSVVFLSVLTACSHAGLVDVGRSFFDHMILQYQIRPGVKHYGCMIDLLGRAGKLNDARKLVESMPYKPNASVFGSLLAAARTHHNIELGEYALSNLIEVEPHNSANYSILSNIYASEGIWDASRNARKLMREKGVKKDPGISSIEVGGIIHEFLATDSKKYELENCYDILAEINTQIKECIDECSRLNIG